MNFASKRVSTVSRLGRRRALSALTAFVSATAVAGLAALHSPSIHAQAWPTKTVRIVVPFSTGGTADTLARIIAQQLTKQLGESFVVDNKPGAGATIGTAEVARLPADGYTALVHTTTFTISQHVYPNLAYDGQKDFVPIGLLMTTPLILITGPGSEIKTVADYIRAAKAKPGQISFSSSGSGSTPHLAFEMLKQTAGIDLLHVPYKGGGEAITAVIAGNTHSYFAAPIEVSALIKSGKLVALGLDLREAYAGTLGHADAGRSGRRELRAHSLHGAAGPQRHAAGHRQQAFREPRARAAGARGSRKNRAERRRPGRHAGRGEGSVHTLVSAVGKRGEDREHQALTRNYPNVDRTAQVPIQHSGKGS